MRAGGLLVVRDDLVPGGTKARVIPLLFGAADEYCYASPAQGYAQVALALAAKAHGKRATIFVAARALMHPLTQAAAAAGAQIIQVRPGYLTVVQARARAYCRARGAVLLPFGFDHPVIHAGLAELARLACPEAPPACYVAAGSGVITRALQAAWPPPQTRHVAVRVGSAPDAGLAEVIQAPEAFAQDCARSARPPISSCLNYDAKVWRVVSRAPEAGRLWWNVAGAV
jgi:hypothetical protein